MQPLLNRSCSVFDRVLQRALPDSGHTPTKSRECLYVSPVALNIAQEFLLPELFVGLRGSGVATTFVPMPEATMDKHYRPVLREHKVRGSGQLSDMKPIAKSPTEKKGAKSPFRPSVLSANTRHHMTALRGSRDVHGLGGVMPRCLQKPPPRISASQFDRMKAIREMMPKGLICS